MIVRVSGEGQFELDDRETDRLNELDAVLDAAVESGDEMTAEDALRTMVEWVRARGRPIGPSELRESEAVLPPPNITYDDLQALLSDDGLVPG